MNPRKKIVFMGTPEVCLPYLDALNKKNDLYELFLVVTNPDRPVGRKLVLTSPPVKVWSNQNNIPCWQPESINRRQALDYFKSLKPDLSIVVAYGNILSQTIIDTPTLGTINIHYSLLPKWRGASPVEASILHGDKETGVCIQQMVKSLDAGPILASQKHIITPNSTAPQLKEELTLLGTNLLLEHLPSILSKTSVPKNQIDSDASYCFKIAKADAEIKLTDDPDVLWRKYLAFYDWPKLFFYDQKGVRTIITKAELINGRFIPTKIIPAGGKEKDYTNQ